MISTTILPPTGRTSPAWHKGFLSLMPEITRYAKRAFRHFKSDRKAEAIQEVTVDSMLMYLRLFERGKVELAFSSVLARLAIARYRDGRRVGVKMNCHDVSSPYAQRRKGIQLDSINNFHCDDGTWKEILIEDKHAGPADTAVVRIDFEEWMSSLSDRDRKIAEALSEGETTQDVALRFHVSSGRISQKRRGYLESWNEFQTDDSPSEGNGRLCE